MKLFGVLVVGNGIGQIVCLASGNPPSWTVGISLLVIGTLIYLGSDRIQD